MLPEGDRTPEYFTLPRTSTAERFKKPIRRLAYPVYNYLCNVWLSRRYGAENFMPDRWLRGQRGNDYATQRRRVNRLFPLEGKHILIAGCGTGRDMPSWLRFRPATLDGVDFFSYQRAWDSLVDQARKEEPTVSLGFHQADLTALTRFPDSALDVVGSDAVFEHLRNLPQVLAEFYRILKRGGIVYATFGPLWHSWGGDHISGFDGVLSGYNHLVLDSREYECYLSSAGEYNHSEHDGRTWVEHDLFSRLKPEQYLRCLSDAGFERLFVAAILDPRAEQCLQRDKGLRETLLARFNRLDLLVTGMTIIYRKPL